MNRNKKNLYRKNPPGILEYTYDIPGYVQNQWYVVVGNPIVSPDQLYNVDAISPAYIVHTYDRFIPKILKDAGIVKSTGEVKRTRPDLFINFPESYLGFFSITLGNYMKTWETNYITFLVGK